VVRDATSGRRHADKLAKVSTREGGETWVLVHVEVQGDAEAGFAERMYVYNYRLFDKHRTDIVSLTVLADATAGFRPSVYARERWGCALQFRFTTCKLLDLNARWAELEADPNPFALVVMAHLEAQEAKDGPTRKRWKMRLVRLLYQRDQRGDSREDILELFRVLDRLLQLPEGLEQEFKRELIAFEEQSNMPYITSIERLGRQEGRQEGQSTMLLSLLAVKFGPLSEAERRRVLDADAPTLLEWSTRLLSADTLEQVFQTSPRPDAPR
jgi:hypothetical protein